MAHRQRARHAGIQRETVDHGVAELIPDPDRRRAWTLLIDGTPQSHVDLDDPRHLEFEYIRRFGHVVDMAAPPGRPLRVLHLGGGALTLARYVAATRPGSGQQVVEVDTALVAFVRGRLPLERTWRIRIRTGDARQVLSRAPEGAFDVVVADVFAAGRTPPHVTSVEFVAASARALRGSGVYAANVADGAPLTFTRAQVATVKAIFPYVYMIAEPAVLRRRRFGNVVLVGTDQELDVDVLTRRAAADPFPARVMHGRRLSDFTAGAAPVTDATARPSPRLPENLFGTQY